MLYTVAFLFKSFIIASSDTVTDDLFCYILEMRVKCNIEGEYKCMKVNMEKINGEQFRIRIVIHDEWNIEKYCLSRWKIEISELQEDKESI